ncbi:hypothetical protein WA026_021822 [Henosepilachna vigintioctopunctata]|uniref:HCLS1-associated protein X-1 n=1 Tax=Henosepilachna vigintioctopunctata TaxID=420089 RepID=A0AAW1URN7_9CUCU
MDDFFAHIRSFLGLPKFDRRDFPEDGRNPSNFDGSRYDAFSDPLEMHRYFEDQMNKILRNFDIFEFGGNDSFFGDIPESGEGNIFGTLEQYPFIEEVPEGSELRDQFLKPGYEKPTQKHSFDKTDKDLDENHLSIRDLDSVVTGKFFKNKQEHPNVTSRFFGKSISTKTVMNPDGSIEIHKTVRDNEGNEETTVTRKIGNKEHSVIKKKDKSGKEEIIENFLNIDENDSNTLLSIPDNSEHKKWFLFDKFFK